MGDQEQLQYLLYKNKDGEVVARILTADDLGPEVKLEVSPVPELDDDEIMPLTVGRGNSVVGCGVFTVVDSLGEPAYVHLQAVEDGELSVQELHRLMTEAITDDPSVVKH